MTVGFYFFIGILRNYNLPHFEGDLFHGGSVHYLALLLYFVVPSLIACMPSLPEGATIQYFPTPKFHQLTDLEASQGEVKAIVTISGKGRIVSIHSVQISPENLPVEPVLTALREARFLMLYGLEVKDTQIVLPFEIDKIAQISIDIPKIDIVVDGI